jgi:HD-like signal output (HDOD) protein
MAAMFCDISYDINKLPPMPLIASRMVNLINSPRASAGELAKVISGDPVISARVLKIANSSFYSMARQVKTLSNAIVILGEKTLKNLVLAASLRGLNSKFGPIEQMLWEDSMTCALGARFLASSLRTGDPEEAFIAGLFRHIGRVLLNNQDPGL